MADELGRGVLGQNLNQLVPRTNEFNRGREVAPIAEITLPDGNVIKGPLHVQPGIADYTNPSIGTWSY